MKESGVLTVGYGVVHLHSKHELLEMLKKKVHTSGARVKALTFIKK
jgi:hypothetical protein